MSEHISNSRRKFLACAVVAAPAVSLLGSSVIPSVLASDRPPASYRPGYFTGPEWDFLNAALDRLIPTNADGPGALEAGVAEFIDRQMNDAYGHGGFWYMQGPFFPDAPESLGYQLRFTPRELYRVGIASLERWCAANHGKPFAELDGATQDSVLGQLEQGRIELDALPARALFAQLLQNTREGYFADPLYGGNKGMGSWKMIGFPGARADFMDWAEQPGKVYPYGPVSIRGNRA
ncbi:gluconate 2-dehydrogenase subunit 3 family protein [Pseudomonas aeruginosa]|uniref:gluconate 2-dehydrogenase subunit 3 family protein n=1 Tax=Pseudomonas aeruginosa TaxID=287 RepID=UPI003BF44401